jgi:hypothetical protein
MTRGSRFLQTLVSDPRAHRAVEETVLDIRSEHTAARTRGDRLVWVLRSAVALGRVGLRVLPLELGALGLGGWALRVAAWATLFAAPIVAMTWMRSVAISRFREGVQALLLSALLPFTLAVVLPTAVFLAAIWPARRSSSPPVLQAGLAAIVVSVVLLATPVGNQLFRSVAYAAAEGRAHSWLVPAPGLREMTVGRLIREAVTDQGETSRSQGARRYLVTQTGLVALAAALALLGAVLRRAHTVTGRVTSRLWLYAFAVPALAFAVTASAGPWGLWISAGVASALALRRVWQPAPATASATLLAESARLRRSR